MGRSWRRRPPVPPRSPACPPSAPARACGRVRQLLQVLLQLLVAQELQATPRRGVRRQQPPLAWRVRRPAPPPEAPCLGTPAASPRLRGGTPCLRGCSAREAAAPASRVAKGRAQRVAAVSDPAHRTSWHRSRATTTWSSLARRSGQRGAAAGRQLSRCVWRQIGALLPLTHWATSRRTERCVFSVRSYGAVVMCSNAVIRVSG